MNQKHLLLVLLAFIQISLYAQHTTDLFIQGTTGFGFPKNESAEYLQSELLITSSTRFTDLLSLELSSIIVDQGSADAIIGVGFQVTPSLRLIPGIGLTNNPINPLRLGVSVDYFTKDYTGLGIFKWGPETSYFYFYEFVKKINKFELGIRGERFMLNGIHLGYNPKPYFLIFTSPGYDFEFKETRLAVGIAVTFR